MPSLAIVPEMALPQFPLIQTFFGSRHERKKNDSE